MGREALAMPKGTSGYLVMIFLLLVVISSGADLIADFSEGVATFHLLQEFIVMVAAASVFFWLALRVRHSKVELEQLHLELEAIRKMRSPESEQMLVAKRQLAEAIAEQFEVWGLSKSEREVGLLLLKGFSLKEISALRGVTGKTVRQQASAIYKKASLPGRHAFSAWFIEDIL